MDFGKLQGFSNPDYLINFYTAEKKSLFYLQQIFDFSKSAI